MNKDEKKMIEEMIEEMAIIISGSTELDTMNYYSARYKAKALINAGYHKIADDEIVVKKSEYEKKLNEYYEQGRASAFGDIEEQKDVRVLTKEEFYNLKPTLIYDIEAIDKAKQETAREIINKIEDIANIEIKKDSSCEKYFDMVLDLLDKELED